MFLNLLYVELCVLSDESVHAALLVLNYFEAFCLFRQHTDQILLIIMPKGFPD